MKWLALLRSPCDAAYAAEPKPNAETFLDPSKAGQDYLDQGEYRNDWGVRRSSPPSLQLSDGDLPRRFARRWLGQRIQTGNARQARRQQDRFRRRG